MNNKQKELLLDLKIVAAHFRLRLSSIEVLGNAAIALDRGRKKLLVMMESDHPYFKTIDLENVVGCAIKVEYRSIDAGDLQEKNMDEFIDNIHLHISHTDPLKSVIINFYNSRRNTIDELKPLANKATTWRDRISEMLPKKLVIASPLKPTYHEQ